MVEDLCWELLSTDCCSSAWGHCCPPMASCQAVPRNREGQAAHLSGDLEISSHMEREGSWSSFLEVQAAHMEVYLRAVVQTNWL